MVTPSPVPSASTQAMQSTIDILKIAFAYDPDHLPRLQQAAQAGDTRAFMRVAAEYAFGNIEAVAFDEKRGGFVIENLGFSSEAGKKSQPISDAAILQMTLDRMEYVMARNIGESTEPKYQTLDDGRARGNFARLDKTFALVAEAEGTRRGDLLSYAEKMHAFSKDHPAFQQALAAHTKQAERVRAGIAQLLPAPGSDVENKWDAPTAPGRKAPQGALLVLAT